jgi:peptide/nickel transport system permease protein
MAELAQTGEPSAGAGAGLSLGWPGNRRLATMGRSFARNRLAAAGIAVVVLFMLAAVLAPVFSLPDPNATDPPRRLEAVGSPGYPLGTDHLGRDLLSRMVWGARVTILMGVVTALIASTLGCLLGIVAGFSPSWLDNTIMRVIDVLMAFPFFLLALALVSALGPGLFNAMLALAVASVPFYARTVRAQVLSIRTLDYVQAAYALGANTGFILLRHVLPNVLATILIAISIDVGWLITGTAALSFVGLGTQPPTADWGRMVAEGRQYLLIAPHAAVVPGVAITILVLSLNLGGDAVRDALDPRLVLR